MGMTEKNVLLNNIVMDISENFDISIKSLKPRIADILQKYHISISDESFKGEDLTTEYLLKKFRDGKKSIGMSDNTLKQYIVAINRLEEITQKQLSDIESEDIRNFLQTYKAKVSTVTLRGKYQLIHSVYNWLYKNRYIPHNPMLSIEPPKADIIVKTPLSDLDVEKLKKSCEQLTGKESVRDMALLYFFMTTGCRISELRNISIGDVDFEKKVCKVFGKGRKERFVVLNDKTIYRLKLYLNARKHNSITGPLFASIRGEEKELTKGGIENIIHKLRRLCNLPKLTAHGFRRYYATELRKRNVPIQMIASSLGHSNLNQINRYSLYSSEEMQNSIRQVL